MKDHMNDGNFFQKYCAIGDKIKTQLKMNKINKFTEICIKLSIVDAQTNSIPFYHFHTLIIHHHLLSPYNLIPDLTMLTFLFHFSIFVIFNLFTLFIFYQVLIFYSWFGP